MIKKKSFKCRDCDHRFRQNYAPKLCPNCGRESVGLDYSQGGAEELLKEIDNMQNQF